MILKKPVFILCFIFFMQTGYAQIPKNTFLTGGSLGFQYATNKQSMGNNIIFSLNPVFGNFVAKNFVLGIAPLVNYSQQTTSSSFANQFTIGAGPFARYYVRIASNVYVYFHAAPVTVSAEWDKFSHDATQPYYKTIMINWAVGPGLTAMFAKGIAVEVGVYYNGFWHRQSILQNGNLLGNEGTAYIDHGMVFNVGFQVYLERKKKEAQPEKAK